MGGKGKGKGGPPPPPPSGEEAARANAELKAKREKEKQEAEERIARDKELEAAQQALRARLPTLQGHDIASVPWEQAITLVHLSGGKGAQALTCFGADSSGGVDVYELPGGAVCVRKGSRLIGETIADALAAALDVRVARLRLVDPESDEGKLIQETCKRLSSETGLLDIQKGLRQLEKTDPDSFQKLKGFLDAKYTCAVLEFVPGLTLDAAQETLAAPPLGFLTGLGELLGLDLLINNMDRVPLPCWTSQGNLSNAIVTPGGDLVGIDQQVNRVEDGPGLDAYLADVRRLSSQLLRGGGEAPPIAAGVRAALERHCGGATLSDESMDLVLQAMRKLLLTAASRARDGVLEAALAAAAEAAGRVRAEMALPAGESAARDVDFVRRTVNAVREAEETPP